MNEKKNKRISKRMSYLLRHAPETAGLELDEAGWIDVKKLIAALRVDHATIEEVVATNDKQRFEFSEDRSEIRARQGHSVDVELEYEPADPPEILLHGTATRNLDSIREKGLHKAGRHHVHLSTNEKTMRAVGSRHGQPVIVRIDAARMHSDGHKFYITGNDVWLTDNVPPSYLLWDDETITT